MQPLFYVGAWSWMLSSETFFTACEGLGQGFDPLASALSAVIAFMERIEMSEDFDGNKKTTEVAPGKSKKKSGFAKGNSDADGSKHCMLHGNNNTHDASECKTLMVHYAKSYRPFELFVNENYKL